MLNRIQNRHRFMLRYSRALLSGLRRPSFIYLTILSFSFMGLASVVMYFCERGQNPQIETIFEALYFVVGIMTGGGSSQLSPVTVPARAFAMLLMLMGTAIFVTYTAILASVLIEVELRLERKSD